jgi:hypothetical protein
MTINSATDHGFNTDWSIRHLSADGNLRMRDFASAHVATARSGEYVMIKNQACMNIWDCPRGHVAVEDDGKTYFYRVSRSERGAFRQWAADVFSGMNCRKLRGAWPAYHVEG